MVCSAVSCEYAFAIASCPANALRIWVPFGSYVDWAGACLALDCPTVAAEMVTSASPRC